MTQLGILLLILVLSAYRMTSDSTTEDFDENLKSNVSALSSWLGEIPVIGLVFSSPEFSEQVWCAYANPYLSRFFSTGGELTLHPNDAMFEAFGFVLGTGTVSPIKVWTVAGSSSVSYLVGDYTLEDLPESIRKNEARSGNSFYNGTLELDKFSKGLNDYSASEDFSFMKLNNKIPAWVCFITYGFLPMLVMYFFLRDLLNFTLLSNLTKQLISIFSALISIQLGLFSGFVMQIAKIARLSTGGAFLSLIIFLSMSSVILSWMGAGAGASARAKGEAQELAEGMAQKATASAFYGMFAKDK